jgi:hypothetical protein
VYATTTRRGGLGAMTAHVAPYPASTPDWDSAVQTLLG